MMTVLQCLWMIPHCLKLRRLQVHSGSAIGNSQRNLDSVVQFTKDNKMQLHLNKCKKMQMTFE